MQEESRRLAAQRETDEARVRDEERRRQETEKEVEKELNDKRTQSMNEQFEYEGGDEEYPQVAEKEDEYDEGYETDNTEDVTITTTKTTKLMKPMVEESKGVDGDDGSDMIMEKDEMEDDKEPIRKEDEKLIDSIKHVFNKAVDETVKEHPIEEDEYWDETSKKTDEDSWTAENEGTKKTEEADEYGMEEGTEGWMMVKKENENAAVGTTVSLITVTFLFTLIF